MPSASHVDGVVKSATQLCQKEYLQNKQDNVDGIVCCIHTEGSEASKPHNYEYVLRTLAGLVVHPNVGAGVVVYNDSSLL